MVVSIRLKSIFKHFPWQYPEDRKVSISISCWSVIKTEKSLSVKYHKERSHLVLISYIKYQSVHKQKASKQIDTIVRRYARAGATKNEIYFALQFFPWVVQITIRLSVIYSFSLVVTLLWEIKINTPRVNILNYKIKQQIRICVQNQITKSRQL